MNAEQSAAQLVEAQRAAIKSMRPSISYTFTGETYVDALGRVWHEGSANGTPVWMHCKAEDTISCFDIDEINFFTKREPREATLDEVWTKLNCSDDFEAMTSTGRLVKLQTSETAGTLHLHVFRAEESGNPVYVRGWVDARGALWLSVAGSLDYWG